jgi:hypothetical protein
VNTLRPQPQGIPVPRPSRASIPYWEACRRGELRYQRCRRCATISAKPGARCAACQSDELVWEPSGGTGRLYSWTVVWRAQHPSFVVPYAPAIVKLDEGWYLLSAVVGCEPEDLREGVVLAVEFHPVSDDISLPYFHPVAAGV